MIIDIHSHMLNKNFDIEKFKPNFATWMFCNRLNIKNFDEYFIKMKTELNKSPVDKAVLCALENTPLCSDNTQTAEICSKNEEFLYGANINPLDKNACEQLAEAIKNNAVLIKVLPSFQNIDLSDKKCVPFFEMLKENNLPLLVHTGIEHTLRGGNQDLNNPVKLKLALETGVKVIAAHCGTKLNFWEKDYFETCYNMMLEYKNLYGDLSAMIWFYRHEHIKKILKNPKIQEKLLFGTDYPSYPFLNLKKDNNIFSDWYYYFKELNFSFTIYSNYDKLILKNV